MRRFCVLIGLCGLLASAFGFGCGTARVITRTQEGGEVALEGDRDKARKEALRLIGKHCRGPYHITEEGEIVVGSDTVQSSQSFVTADGQIINTSHTQTRQNTEWRIKYQCDGQARAPAATPDPAQASNSANGSDG